MAEHLGWREGRCAKSSVNEVPAREGVYGQPEVALEYQGILPEDSGRAMTWQLDWLPGFSGGSLPWPRFIMLQKESQFKWAAPMTC